ncbi:MAG: hypothetical protein V3U54_04860 [Thermodesulfobacteriota bacterium]
MQEKQHSEVEPHSSWTDQEKWVWSKISTGEIANFNEGRAYGGTLDPREPGEWPKSRILTPDFLQVILFDDSYRCALTHRGVRIIGAWFTDTIVLTDATVALQLWFGGSRFDSKVKLVYFESTQSLSFVRSTFTELTLRGAVIKHALNMNGCKFEGKLTMDGLQVGGLLAMSDEAKFKDVNLCGAKIGDQLDMSGSVFTGTLNMDKIQVESSLFMRSTVMIKEVILLSAKIDGQLDMSGSIFFDKLDMNSLEVKDSLFMRSGVMFKEVILRGAKIQENLEMNGSRFNGNIDMTSVQIGSHLFMQKKAVFAAVNLSNTKVEGILSMDSSIFSGNMTMENLEVVSQLFMRSSKFEALVSMIFANIGSSLIISDSKFLSLNLTGTQIGKEFCLGTEIHPKTKWETGSTLILRNTKVGALQDLPDAWPDKLELVGFTYSQLGGFAAGERQSMYQRSISWMREWLEKQNDYSPQPYEQLGKVLREAGYKTKANDILFEGKKRERREALTWPTWLTWFNLTLQHIFVGYGYRFRFTFFWVIALTIIGAFVLKATGQGLANRMPCGLSYSLDMLLPIIRLNESHYAVKLVGIAKYYFYGHIILGYVLASFLIAGLSGITKK